MTVFNAIGVPDGEQIEHKMLSSAIERAQEKIEGNNFGIRKNLLEYDQVMNEQREIIYEERRRVLDGENMHDVISNMLTEYVDNLVGRYTSSEVSNLEWDIDSMNRDLATVLALPPVKKEDIEKTTPKELKEQLQEMASQAYAQKEVEFEADFRELERTALLSSIDRRWMDHIDDMDQLRQGIGLQSYGQKNPLVEYKMLGYDMFGEMTDGIATDTIMKLLHARKEQTVEREVVAKVTGTNKDESLARAPKKREEKKVYPNEPCPCGSGKKYKQCCGRK